MMDPKTAKVREKEREILATLREHPPSGARDEQIATLAEEYKTAVAEAPETPPAPTEEQLIEQQAQALVRQSKARQRAAEILSAESAEAGGTL